MSGWRRPGSRWCTDTAIRLVRLAAREPLSPRPLLDAETATLLLRAAGALDAYGQAVEAERAKR